MIANGSTIFGPYSCAYKVFLLKKTMAALPFSEILRRLREGIAYSKRSEAMT